MKAYETGQRKAIVSFFIENSGKQFSVDQIVAGLSARAKISRSAVYRNMDRMTRDGLVRKSLAGEGRKPVYQYIGCSGSCQRVHLRCEKCGKVLHLEDESVEQALKSILQSSGFRLDERAAMLPGTCSDCV